MLIVLVILGVLATVAVQSMAPMADQARFEATQRTLENIRAAIVGPADAASTSQAVTGFVADVGRLPTKLEELLTHPNLLTPPADTPDFGLAAAPAPFSDAQIPRGWRGPYLRLPIGGTQLLDGWGLPLQTTVDSSAAPSTLTATSPGVNRPTQTAGYLADLSTTIVASDWQATLVTGKLYAINGSDSNRRIPPSAAAWQVILLSPGPASVNNGVAQQTATVTTSVAGEVDFSFTSGLSVGPRLIRIMKNGAPVAGSGSLIVLRPGAVHAVDLLVE